MEHQELTGKDRVRLMLWQRLKEAGVRPCLKMTEATFDQMQARVVSRLAYMSETGLTTLAETLISVIASRQGDRCPGEVVVLGYAEAIEKRPFEQHPIVTSWLSSVEGPAAEAGGYHVALYRWLRRNAPPPPLKFDMLKIKEQAQRDHSRNTLLQDRLSRGVISDDERAELTMWERDRDAVEKMIDQGRRARAVAANAEAVA